jgi:asparagine synthase (glutamine-hydrolysing)
MCGICGQYSPAGADQQLLGRMLRAIVHRGPDDEGTYFSGPVGLGSRRLSIIDVAGGRQPISNEDGTVSVVFNGEIYNHQELHAELEARGHRFRTRTDTEVIVHLYEEMGTACVDRLRGMFAFAIWDGPARRLVLARDRLGQKPLFYAERGEDFLFASEVKAILAAGDRPRQLDFESLHHYLSLRFIPPPRTMFREIRKVPPGHVLVREAGRTSVTRYWRLTFGRKASLSPPEVVERLESGLREAVRTHMVSDVPVGALLSGGLDSSIVVAFAAPSGSQPLQTFSIGVKEQDFDELPYARLVADHCRTRHTELRVDIDVLASLPRIIWHMDEPSDPIAACQFASAELAARDVKVVLGGDGGDEMFAGFDRYLGIRHVDRYARLPSWLRRRIIPPLLRKVPDSFGYKSVAQKLRWTDQLSALPGTAERYAAATCFFRFRHDEKQELFGESLWSRLREHDSARVIVDRFNEADSDDTIDRMLYADYTTRLPEHSLMLTDRMAMAHGLELRSPLLDHELVEFMASVPSSFKIRRGQLKYVLRQLATAHLPPTIVKRPKQGFMFPVAYWFRNELGPFLSRFWTSARLLEEGIVRQAYVQRLVEEHRRGQVDHHVRLWMLLNVEVWFRIYMDRRTPSEVTTELLACLAASGRPGGPLRARPEGGARSARSTGRSKVAARDGENLAGN